jgi:hypothetical protein
VGICAGGQLILEPAALAGGGAPGGWRLPVPFQSAVAVGYSVGSGRRGAMLRLSFYLAAGIATGVPVLRLLGASVWGVPRLPLEYVSLAGSLLLVLAAFLSLGDRRLAGKVAFLGFLGTGAFYVPIAVQAVQLRLKDQRLTVRLLKWQPGPGPLVATDPLASSGSPAALPGSVTALLQRIGITGHVVNQGVVVQGRGAASEAILLLQHPVDGRVRLPQPSHTQVVYVQNGNGWRMFPPTSATVDRVIELSPLREDPFQTIVQVESVYGSMQGQGTVFPRHK